MDADSLKVLFGESLDYYYEGKAYSILFTPPKDWPKGVQLPPLWRIDFTISRQGIVTDYSLTKGGEK